MFCGLDDEFVLQRFLGFAYDVAEDLRSNWRRISRIAEFELLDDVVADLLRHGGEGGDRRSGKSARSLPSSPGVPAGIVSHWEMQWASSMAKKETDISEPAFGTARFGET